MEVSLLKHQWHTLTSKAKYKALLSGIGGGKTWCGVHWILKNATEFPNALGFIGATTHGQLRNSTMNAVFNELSRLEIPFSYNQSSGILEILGARILCKSMENYEPLRGIEVGYVWLDEAAYMKKEAYDVILGRLRDKNGPLELLLTTTPNGFNWVFDHYAGELKTDAHLLIKATSNDNIHLPDGYLDSLKEQYDEKMVEQELLGEFVNLTQGQVYYAFDKKVNIESVEQQPGTLYYFCDFNVDPMAGVLAQFIDGKIYCIDEVYLRNSDTYKVCHELRQRNYGGCLVVPDSTGSNRKTSGMSDFAILRSEGHEIVPTRNPAVIDRVNNVNRLLGKKMVIIDPKCKKLINDLEKVTWKDGNLDQKTDKSLTHISDALGYGAYKLIPFTGKRKSRMIQL